MPPGAGLQRRVRWKGLLGGIAATAAPLEFSGISLLKVKHIFGYVSSQSRTIPSHDMCLA